jgi:hypothetical protein
MTMMLTMAQELLPPDDRVANRARSLVWAAVALAAAGAVLAVVLVVQALSSDEELAVGTPADTSYGSFTVTRATTTFVPATQGPPTMAKMMGTVGADQLQVWVRFVNNDAAEGVRYDPDQMRLLVGEPGSGDEVPVAGSSLEPGTLPMGAGIDGQVWFDVEGVDADLDRWLEYTAPDGTVLQVPLPDKAPVAPSHGHGGDGH